MLLTLADQQKYIPFIGLGASSFARDDGQPWIPTSIGIAKEWIKEYDYPFGRSSDSYRRWVSYRWFISARVAQFLAIENNHEMFPKYLLTLIIRFLTLDAIFYLRLGKILNNQGVGA